MVCTLTAIFTIPVCIDSLPLKFTIKKYLCKPIGNCRGICFADSMYTRCRRDNIIVLARFYMNAIYLMDDICLFCAYCWKLCLNALTTFVHIVLAFDYFHFVASFVYGQMYSHQLQGPTTTYCLLLLLQSIQMT